MLSELTGTFLRTQLAVSVLPVRVEHPLEVGVVIYHLRGTECVATPVVVEVFTPLDNS